MKDIDNIKYIEYSIYLCLNFVLNKTYINYNANSQFVLKRLDFL